MGVHYKDQTKLADCKSSVAFIPNRYYAITIKQTGTDNYTSPEELYHQLQLLATKRRSIDIGHYVYEMDSKNRLHLHAIISCKDFFARQKKGWHIHSSGLDSFDDIKRWYDYLYKEAYNEASQDQILTTNVIYNSNIFCI